MPKKSANKTLRVFWKQDQHSKRDQMDKLLLLHDLQKSARHAGSLRDLEFFIPNETYKLIPYEQCVFWIYDAGRIELRSASGGGQIDTKSPFAVWVSALLKHHIKGHERIDEPISSVQVLPLTSKDIPPELKKDGTSYAHEHGLILFFFSPDQELIGGMWLDRKREFEAAEIKIFEELTDQYAVSLHHFMMQHQRDIFFGIWGKISRMKKYILIGIVALCLFPVRLAVTAPAEIIAQDAKVIAAPYDGIVEEVLVDPGTQVEEGDLIVRMDQTGLKAEAEIAQQSLKVAQANISQTKRMAISNPDKHAELGLMREQIRVAELEYEYANTLLERSELKAPQDGVAVYGDKSSIEGAPFATGQMIVKIADPAHYELLVRIPVDALIPFNKDTPIHFYPNARPLSSVTGTIHVFGFQATPDPDGLLSYKLRAKIDEKDKDDLRIGWKGTAKIYGGWTILSYAILRRPLASLRQMVGA